MLEGKKMKEYISGKYLAQKSICDYIKMGQNRP